MSNEIFWWQLINGIANNMKIQDFYKQPVAYVLVGLPGSGKSTWMRSMLANGNYVIISSDNEIEEYAKSVGLTYSDVFDEYIKTATSNMNAKFKDAVANNKNIIWDQTNMSVKKRKSILQQIPKQYKKIAVVFQLEREELQKRLDKRAELEGKHIPMHVIDNMERSFEIPTVAEGFDEVVVA
jgi:predicted kinase